MTCFRETATRAAPTLPRLAVNQTDQNITNLILVKMSIRFNRGGEWGGRGAGKGAHAILFFTKIKSFSFIFLSSAAKEVVFPRETRPGLNPRRRGPAGV